MAAKEVIDPYLDYLYNSNVRCPYCKRRIVKYTTVCQRCGVHKKQIAESSNVRAKQIKKEKSGAKLFSTRRRPRDVSFTSMALFLIIGMFGAHRFLVGRKISGWIMLVCGVVGFVGIFLPENWREWFNEAVPLSPAFPTDIFFAVAFVMWAWDCFAVVFGYFSYPIRLGEVENEKQK